MVTDPATTSKLQSTGKLPPDVGSKPPNQPEEKVEEVAQSKTQKKCCHVVDRVKEKNGEGSLGTGVGAGVRWDPSFAAQTRTAL